MSAQSVAIFFPSGGVELAPTVVTAVGEVPAIGVWLEMQLGAGSLAGPRRIFVPNPAVYPVGGVSFYLNDVLNRNDPTGRNEGSEFHTYPVVTLAEGDELRAEWVDSSGIAHSNTYVVPGAPGSLSPPVLASVVTATGSVPLPTTVTPPTPGPISIPNPNSPIITALESGGLTTGWPQQSNTGCRVAEGSLTVYNGEYVMTAGETLTNTLINGNLVPKANCVVRDCIIRFNHNYGIDVRAQEVGGSISPATRPLIEYCTIDGVNASAFDSPCYGEGNPFRIVRCVFKNHGAPVFMTSNQAIEDSIIESHRYDGDIHKEAIFHNGGNNNLISGNVLIGNGSGTSAALALYGEVAAVQNMTVTGNLMVASQGYTMYTGSLSYKPFPTGINVDVTDNHFMELWHYNAQWDIVGHVAGSTTNGVWSGNVIHNGPNEGDPV